MPGVQFTNQADMNGFKVTELGPGTSGTDAVNLNQLTAGGPQGHAQTIGDGTNTTFTITHGFNTSDVITAIYEIATGTYVVTDAQIATANTVEVAFGSAPATNQYRVLIIPVP